MGQKSGEEKEEDRAQPDHSPGEAAGGQALADAASAFFAEPRCLNQSPALPPRSACCKLRFLRVCNRTSPLRALRGRAGARQVSGSRQGIAVTSPRPVPKCQSASLRQRWAVPRGGGCAGGRGGLCWPEGRSEKLQGGRRGSACRLVRGRRRRRGSGAALAAPGTFVNPQLALKLEGSRI